MNWLTEFFAEYSIIAAITFAAIILFGGMVAKMLFAKYQSQLRLKEAKENRRRKNLEKLESAIGEIEVWLRKRDEHYRSGGKAEIEASPIEKIKEIVKAHFSQELGKEMCALVDADGLDAADLLLFVAKQCAQNEVIQFFNELNQLKRWNKIFAAKDELIAAVGRLNAELSN